MDLIGTKSGPVASSAQSAIIRKRSIIPNVTTATRESSVFRRSFVSPFPQPCVARALIWDADGKRYLDFSGSAAPSTLLDYGVPEILPPWPQAARLEFVTPANSPLRSLKNMPRNPELRRGRLSWWVRLLYLRGSESIETALKLSSVPESKSASPVAISHQPATELSRRDQLGALAFRKPQAPAKSTCPWSRSLRTGVPYAIVANLTALDSCFSCGQRVRR